MDDLYEFRRKRYILRHIVPLNLVDPFRDDFSPRACRTLHDILRYMHEKAVGRLIEAAGFGARSVGAVKLDLPIPAGMTVIDIGGGLSAGDGREHASPEQITSVPFKALVRGMTHPGAWRSEAVALSVNDFMSSMFHAPDLAAESDRQMGSNVAVISRGYVNLNIKFGYHYTILDSYVSDTPRSNHIYFRFAGGATDMTKRSRRLQLIERILLEHGFRVTTRGDLLIGRLSGLGREEMTGVLDQVGRLVSFTRQMDAVLGGDHDIEVYADNFLHGRYEAGAGKRIG
jgi:pyruvate,water dikinase